ncbi:MAG: hypothetical protein PSX80_04710 [bacterium]|nr:hypothetical protein [bacterium]
MDTENVKFVLCIDNEGCEDLEVRKIYEVLPDETAEKDDYIRVIDESGEDYVYPASCFYPVEIAPQVRETLLHAA